MRGPRFPSALVLLFLVCVLLLNVTPASADVPVFMSYRLIARENHLFLNFVIRHNNPTSTHYVDLVQVDVDGTIHDLDQNYRTEQDFSVEYDLGEVSTIPPTQARAHCTVHGWSAWVNATLGPTPSPPTNVEYNCGVLEETGISFTVTSDPPTGLWWLLIRVVAVSGKEVTLRTTGEFENGTTTTQNTAVYNVETGTMNGTPSVYGPIIAANLNEGDPLSKEPPGSNIKINRTEIRDYSVGSRTVNIVDTTISTTDYTNRWMIVYDKATGIMLEMETESIQTAPTQTTMRTKMVVHGTDILPTPTISPPPVTSPTPTPTQTVTPTPTVTPPSGSPTVAPPTGTPQPTATPTATPTPQPKPVDYTTYYIVGGIIAAIIIAAIIWLVRRK